MFKEITYRDGLLIVVLVLLTIIGGYWYANPSFSVYAWQQLYPLHARVALTHLQCSSGSPGWLPETLRYMTLQQNAPANQMVYINPQGQASHCESGYIDTPRLSDKVVAQTRFRYASVTKLWTADAVLQLINRNELSLDTRLADVLTEMPPPQDKRVAGITVAQLLRHEGGFDRYSIFGQDMFNPGQEPLCPRQLDKLAAIRLGFDPGSKSSYSNLGYCLLGEMVARQNGLPYPQAMMRQYRLADDGIRFLEKRRFGDEVSYNHNETGLTGVGDIYTAYDYPALASAAGLSGNALALAKQVKAMIGKPGLNILSQPAGLACGRSWADECYGYAMSPYQPPAGGLKVYVRSGALLGMASLVVVDEYGGVTVLLSNGRPDNPSQGVVQKQAMIYRYLQQQYGGR